MSGESTTVSITLTMPAPEADLRMTFVPGRVDVLGIEVGSSGIGGTLPYSVSLSPAMDMLVLLNSVDAKMELRRPRLIP